MDTENSSPLTDIQKERDHRELRIDKVGVRGLRFPIRIRDKAHAHQDTIATVECLSIYRIISKARI